MKTGLKTFGYTIIEVLIVFAITGALLVTAMTYTAGQQNKNQFTQSINDIKAQIDDVINNVQTGYYADVGGFTCSASSTGPDIQTAASTNQGTNDACTFLGRAMQFMVGGDPLSYNIYNIAGLRLKYNSLQAVSGYTDAFPTAIYPGASSHTTVPDAAQKNTLLYGIRATSIKYNGGAQTANAVAFLTDLGANNTQVVNLIPIQSGSQAAGSVVDAIDSIDDGTVKNPSGGVNICFQSGGTSQYGIVNINNSQRKLTTKLTIGSGNCP